MFVLCVCVCVTSCRPTSGEHVGEVRLCASEARISIITGQQVLLCAIRARHSASLLQTVVLLQESCVFARRRGVRRVVTLPIHNEDFILLLSLQGSHPPSVYLRFPRSPHSIFLLLGGVLFMDGGPCGRSRSVTSTSKSSHARRQRPLKKIIIMHFLKITKTAKQDVSGRNYLTASKCIQKAASPSSKAFNSKFNGLTKTNRTCRSQTAENCPAHWRMTPQR